MDGSKDARGFYPLWIVLPVVATVVVALVGVMIVVFVVEFTPPAQVPQFSPSQAIPRTLRGHPAPAPSRPAAH
ncbi:MAG: hypothetical protein M0T84_04370 [Betaproteobacteria bacterium]|nr:hypothetical protein [Betaproteobacteria bacterium]